MPLTSTRQLILKVIYCYSIQPMGLSTYRQEYTG